MSYTIVKKVAFKPDGVYFTAASNNVYPRNFDVFRSEGYSKMLASEGFDAVVKALAGAMKDGVIQFRKGTKFCNCMLAAKAELDFCKVNAYLSGFLNKEVYGDYILKSFHAKFSKEHGFFDASVEQGKLLAMLKDPEAVFAMCKENPDAFYFSDKSIQEDKELCRRYVKEHAGDLMFRFPLALQEDLESVHFAVSKHGCVFRHLPFALRDNPEVVLAAFGAEKYPEHLPDMISPRLQSDVDLMKKVIDVEPKIHFDRSAVMMSHPEIALKLAEKATWISSFRSFPDEILNYPGIQKAMAKRLHDEGLSPEDREKRIGVLSQFVKPEYLVPEQLKDAVAFEYKGIIFDDWTIDSDTNGIWGEICEDCIRAYGGVLSDEIAEAGGFGSCSVFGCDLTGDDCNDSRYIDFKPELIQPLSQEQMYALHPEQKSLDENIAAAQAKLNSEIGFGSLERSAPERD